MSMANMESPRFRYESTPWYYVHEQLHLPRTPIFKGRTRDPLLLCQKIQVFETEYADERVGKAVLGMNGDMTGRWCR
jgi:hypothetical protein